MKILNLLHTALRLNGAGMEMVPSSREHQTTSGTFLALSLCWCKVDGTVEEEERQGGTLTAHFLSFSIQITNFPFVKNYPSSSDCRLATAISLFVLFLLPSPAVLALHLFSQTGKTKKFLQRQMEVQTLKRSVQFYIYLR